MARFERSRIVGKSAEELDELMCGICRDVFIQPMSTPCCRQSYCKDCITEWLSGHNTCPQCRQHLIIANMQIRCTFSRRGCPSVHAISEDAEHLNVCEFSKCKECGLKDPDSGHNCVSYLLEEKHKLTEDNNQMKRMNAQLMSRNQTSGLLMKELQTELDLYKKAKLQRMIMEAKEKPGLVGDNHNINKQFEKILIDICVEAINQFDESKHNYHDLVKVIKTKLVANSMEYIWTVNIYTSFLHFDCWIRKENFIRVNFGSLNIVVHYNLSGYKCYQ